ncbi:hypothetical protein D3C73_1237210 [compost metagenome]
MQCSVWAAQHLTQALVGQGIDPAEHHHVADFAKTMLMGEKQQQFLAGIEPTASQAQPHFPGEHRQL